MKLTRRKTGVLAVLGFFGSVACGQSPRLADLLQDVKPVTCATVKGAAEGTLRFTQTTEQGLLHLELWDADGRIDSFHFSVQPEGNLHPMVTKNRMTFWDTGSQEQAIRAFVQRGFYLTPKPFTADVSLNAYYDAAAILQEGDSTTIALFSGDEVQVYANMPEGGPAFFGIAAHAFDGIYGGSIKAITCCVQCGPTSSCCCNGGDKCVTDDIKRTAGCYKNNKLVEWCACDGSSCGCQVVEYKGGGVGGTWDESPDDPGVGETEPG